MEMEKGLLRTVRRYFRDRTFFVLVGNLLNNDIFH